MRACFTPTFTFLGALFCGAAFIGALPVCLDMLPDAIPAMIYIGIAAAMTILLTRLPDRKAYFCVILILIALGLRLVWSLNAPAPTPDDDYGYYREVQLACLQGDWAQLIWTFFPWGYFIYLYALGWLFGSAPQVPIVANAIIGTATTLLIYVTASRLIGERSARPAAVIYAVWPGVIYWTGVYCSEIPHLFFLLAALLCLLIGSDAEWRRGSWLAAGGLLAALAEFIRPVSLLLLLPFALYAGTGQRLKLETVRGTGSRAVWRGIALALGVYIVCLAALLAAKSLAAGYSNFSASYTLGINLANGLNWESKGAFNLDDYRIWDAADPREVNRRAMRLARQHLNSLLEGGWWKIPALAGVKFKRMWSIEGCGYDANLIGLTEDQKQHHWLSRYGDQLLAAGQQFHALVLGLAAIGFLRGRRSGELAFLGCILSAFVLLHTVIEVDDRYHFAAQSLLAIAAAVAFRTSTSGHPQASV
ncbi:MAG TPA: glycosyltransferase family 39 protein [Acidobacteriota bacterium]|nr:glycosyltransferase family 39 protein [Acidobacteriota bacterium]